MTQLPLFAAAPAPVVAPAEPSVWAALGMWMCGEGPEPRELVEARKSRVGR